MRCIAVARGQHDSDARRARDLASFDQEWLAESADELLGDFQRISYFGQIGHDQRKFVSADPRDSIGLTRASLQSCRGLNEKPISCGVAEFVVHFLKAIEIEEKHRELLARASEPVEGSFEAFVEGETVRQLGQGIPPDPLFGLQLSNGAFREFERMGENAGHRPQRG